MSSPTKSEAQEEKELDERIQELQRLLREAIQEKEKLKAGRVQKTDKNTSEKLDSSKKSSCDATGQANRQSNEQPQHISATFVKRSGTTDRGKDYEHLFIANIILHLVANPDIQDFYISSNNESFGAFDDVVIEIKYKNSEQWHKYAIQLKHKGNVNNIQVTDLTSEKDKNFGIKKYFKDYKNCQQLKNDHVSLILFTNNKATIKAGNSIRFDFSGEEFNATVQQTDHDKLLTSKGPCYKFTCVDDKYSEFFDKFLLYTQQPSVGALENGGLETFKKFLNSEKPSFVEFVNFVYNWSIVEKKSKDKLHKSWMMEVIALRVLTPHIKPLNFVLNSSVDQKTETFRKAVSKFDITTFEKKSWQQVQHIWKDAANQVEFEAVNKTASKYYGEYLKNKQDLEKVNKETSKMLWLLGKCPLVVNTSRALNIKTEKAFFLLSPSVLENFEDFFFQHLFAFDCPKNTEEKCSFFQNLSDLEGHFEIYEEILTTYTYTLEDQPETSLKKLTEVSDDLNKILTTDKLVQMVHGPLRVGEEKEVLPECYISRTLPKVIIESKYLDQLCEDTLVVISCVNNLRTFQKEKKNLKIINLTDRDTFQEELDQFVYITENDCTSEEFMKLCSKKKKSKCHLFKYLNDGNLEWIESKNGVGDLLRFQTEDRYDQATTEEEKFFNNTDNINIVCGDPGMGKSTLMKSLKSKSMWPLWTILICARNHARYFRNKETDVGNIDYFFKYILTENCKTYDSFDGKVCEILMQKGQFQLLWDGLDEASDETFVSVLTIAEKISEKGIRQFITSRNNLRRKLERRFNRFSRSLNQFNEDEQKEYVQKRLELSSEDLDDVFAKIKRNVEMFSYGDILGIPLQIYMLTELLRSDKNKYLLELDKTFTILDLYENFVEEKFNVFGKGKAQYDFNNEMQFENFVKDKMRRTQCYKQIAIQTHFADDIDEENYEFPEILEEIRQDRDHVGIITKIDDSVAQFSHSSYGEYFAALYLFENYDKHSKGKRFIFDQKYNNIRFFLDLFLSRNSKGHIAVLYKNCHLLEECTEEDLDRKDAAGRDILELSCSRSKNFRLLPTIKDDDGIVTLVLGDQSDDDFEYLLYSDVQKYLEGVRGASIEYKKLILLLPFAIQLYNSRNKCFEVDQIPTILYYAVKNDYSTIIDYFEEVPFIKLSNEENSTLLNVSVESKSVHCLRKLLDFSKYFEFLKVDYHLQLRICGNKLYSVYDYCLVKGLDLNSLTATGRAFIHYACERGNLGIIQYLFSKGANVEVQDIYGKLPMHHVCKNRDSLALQIAKFLISRNATLESKDAYGQLPIHTACENDKLKLVRFFLENKAKIDVADSFKFLPIHYACQNGNVEIVQLLIDHGAKLDVGDRLPIHYASKTDVELVKMLKDRGADVNVEDITGKTPMHIACEKGDAEIIEYLISVGAKLNSPDKKGRMPVHYACEKEVELVELLVDRGANLDVSDSSGRMPIHHACINWLSGVKIVQFLIDKGARVDATDGDGRAPMHYTCMNFVYGGNLKQFLVKVKSKRNVEPGNVQTAELLFRNGASFDVADSKGRTPMHYACINRDTEMIMFLKRKKAKVDVVDVDGHKPMYYARGSKHIEELFNA